MLSAADTMSAARCFCLGFFDPLGVIAALRFFPLHETLSFSCVTKGLRVEDKLR